MRLIDLPPGDEAKAIIRKVGVDTGGSNIQFATDPKTGRLIVIEGPDASGRSTQIERITAKLEADGVASFAASYDSLLAVVDARRAALLAEDESVAGTAAPTQVGTLAPVSAAQARGRNSSATASCRRRRWVR